MTDSAICHQINDNDMAPASIKINLFIHVYQNAFKSTFTSKIEMVFVCPDFAG